MKIKISKQEVVNTQATIVALLNRNERCPAKFNHALLRNYDKLMPIVKIIQATQKKTLNVLNEAIKAMQKRINEQAKKEGMKPEAKLALLNKELKAITEDEKHKKEQDEATDYMKSIEEVDFYIVSLEFVPEIEPQYFMKLKHIIKAE